jgi:3-hydroxyacyl-[acyl-carrier-protein] dehydratase
MPAQPLIDLAELDVNKVVVDRDAIYNVNPHRFEFQLLDGILLIDRERQLLAGFSRIRPEAFWVRGHIPGRPLMPGVLMIESAAQLVSYYEMSIKKEEGAFLGFGGVDGVKFRGTVQPGDTLILVGKMVESRARRSIGETQGFVNGKMVYEGIITGMWL